MIYQFEESGLFKGRRDKSTWGISDTHVEAPQPLCDIFYLMQCVVPGILTITREEDPDDKTEFINAQGLPRQEWLERNRRTIELIFDDEGYEQLHEAAGDPKRA
jgi:hypothetical protein